MSSVREQMGTLPEHAQREVLDSATFLRQKQEKALSETMDALIEQNMEALKELAK